MPNYELFSCSLHTDFFKVSFLLQLYQFNFLKFEYKNVSWFLRRMSIFIYISEYACQRLIRHFLQEGFAHLLFKAMTTFNSVFYVEIWQGR